MAKSINNSSAPNIDQLIYIAQQTPVVIEQKIAEKLIDLFHEMSKIEIQGGDELRSIWIEAKRGEIKDFGSYKEYLDEETVSSYKEFTELWESHYHDKTKWYEFSIASYNKEYYFYIDSKLVFHIEKLKKPK